MSEDLLRLIRDSARLLKRSFDARARALGVTREQWTALTMLARNEGINQTRFAEQMDMEPIGLCRMIDRLEAVGLVRRERDGADRRARRLYITREGWARIDRLRPLAQDLTLMACAAIDPARIRAASEVLAEVVANLAADADADAGQTAGPKGKE